MSTLLLVFDVNETLLDVQALAPHFARVFGDQRVLREWFSHLLLFSEACTLTDNYAEFSTLAKAALTMTAESHKMVLAASDADQILESMLALPAHPEVPESLDRLRKAGHRLFALTNSGPQALEKQLRAAGLTQYFEKTFSADTVRRFKPAPEPYRYVASQLDTEPGNLWLIAAHAWDTLGARSAGYHAALVTREGKAPFPWGPQPELLGPNLSSVADQLLSRFKA